jgi:cysteinyl-tRNA synthetase
MLAGARRTGKSAWEIAELYTQAFKDDLDALHILTPHVWCRATDHIQEQIDAIGRIEAQGLAYRTTDGVYFDTSKLSDYGHLARLDAEGLRQGARIDKGEKRSATDFALWKLSPPDQQRQMEWDSPWGRGFPGWHIECSAMSAKYLGELFDIHCGGQDHIPVHHTNEIAQAQACYGTRLANYWLHGYFLQIDESKMAKSSGEFLRVATLVERGYDPLAYRYLCLTAHYRSHLNFTWDALSGAAAALDRIRHASYDWGEGGVADEGYLDRFAACVNDDLNTPQAIALTWELAKSALPAAVKKATLLRFDEVFGLRLAQWAPREAVVPEEVAQLVKQRDAARSEKRWKDADRLRDDLYALGFEIEDTPRGTHIKPRKRGGQP